MTPETIWQLVFQGAGTLIALLAVLLPYLNAQHQKQQQTLKDALNAIREDQKIALAWIRDEVKDLELRNAQALEGLQRALERERDERTARVGRLHERVDEMQKEMIQEQGSKIAKVEGRLEGIENILNKIHMWFIEQAKAGK